MPGHNGVVVALEGKACDGCQPCLKTLSVESWKDEARLDNNPAVAVEVVSLDVVPDR